MFKSACFVILSVLSVSAASMVLAADSGGYSKAGKSTDNTLLNDLVKIPRAGASGGVGAAKEAVIDTIFNRAGQAAQQSEYDVLNRLEFEYGLSEGGVDRYSVLSVQPLYSSESGIYNLFSKPTDVPTRKLDSGVHLLFAQGGYTNMDGRDTAGGDLVYRYMTKDEQALYGAHVGFDHQWPYHHSRMNFGVDYKTSLFGARATHYVGLSDWREGEGNNIEEKVMDGTDVELSGRPSFMPELELFTRGFHWMPDDDVLTNEGDDIWGYEVAAELTPINALTLRVSGTDDNEREDFTGEGTIRLNYNFGMGWDDLLSRPDYDLSSVRERQFDKVRRERTIRVQQRLAGNNTASGPDCPNVGDTCADGSIFAGLSPDGNVRMFTTPADAGLFTWDDDGVFGNEIDTTMVNCTGAEASCRTGEANTALLITEDSNNALGGIQPHDAAQHCSDLIAHGHDDWYLPARDELDVLYDNLVDQDGDNTPGGPLGSTFGFNISGAFPAGIYWSSSEIDIVSAWDQSFSGGSQTSNLKLSGLSVRCVRR